MFDDPRATPITGDVNCPAIPHVNVADCADALRHWRRYEGAVEPYGRPMP